MSNWKVRIGKWLPLLVFIFVVIFSCCTAYHYAYHITDSDAAKELELGKLLADKNKLVTSDWYYSTEIRFFGTNLVYMPLFKILNDWPLIRFLSIIIFQLLLLVSYLYFSRRVELSRRAYFLSAALLLLPAGVVYGRVILYQNYYIPCLVYGFLIAGLSLAILKHSGQHKHLRQVLVLTAMILLSIMSCLNGFRQFPTTMVPLLMTAIVVSLQKCGAKAEFPNDFQKRSRLHIALVCGVCLAGAAGLLIHTLILPRYLSFRQMNQTTVSLPAFEDIQAIGVGYLSLFGYQEGRTLLSLEGLLALAGAMAGVILLLISLSAIRTERKTYSYPDAFCALLFPLSMLCMTAAFLLMPDQDNYPQYYLPSFAWIFPWLGLQIRRMQTQRKRYTIRQVLVVVSCLVLFANGIYHNVFYLHPTGKQAVYDPRIDIASRDQASGRTGAGWPPGWHCRYARISLPYHISPQPARSPRQPIPPACRQRRPALPAPRFSADFPPAQAPRHWP